MPDNRSLRQAIAQEEARLARIEKERTEAIAKLLELKGRLAVEDSAPIPPRPAPSDSLPFPSKAPSTHAEKVALFRSLFRGREDVFPRLWEQNEEGPERIRPRLRQRMGGRGLREAAGQVRQMFPPGVPPRHRPGRPRPSPGPSRHRRLPAAPGRDLLVPGGRLRRSSWQEDVTAFVATCHDAGSRRGRTIPLREGRPRLVLLRGRFPPRSPGRWAAICSRRR